MEQISNISAMAAEISTDRPAIACHANILLGTVSPQAAPLAFETIAGLGYTHVVLPPLDISADTSWLRDLLSRHGLAPITTAGGLTATTDVGSADAAVRDAGARALREVIDLTARLGGRQLNGVPYGVFGHPRQHATPAAFAMAAAAVGDAADYAHDLGITMTFEVLNRYETSLINTARQAVEFVSMSGSAHLRVHLDTFHMAIEESSILDAITLALPVLGYLELGQSGRGALDTGAVDIQAVLRHARRLGYGGPIGVEAFTRSTLGSETGDALAIWGESFDSGVDLARDAFDLIAASLEPEN